jgi:hypothetical protein
MPMDTNINIQNFEENTQVHFCPENFKESESTTMNLTLSNNEARNLITTIINPVFPSSENSEIS